MNAEIGKTRTRRTFTAFDPSGRKFYVVAGWDPVGEHFYVEVWGGSDAWTAKFKSRHDCETHPTFADVAFILKEFGLHFPPDWAHTLLADRDGTCVQTTEYRKDFGTYHATKPPKENPPDQFHPSELWGK